MSDDLEEQGIRDELDDARFFDPDLDGPLDVDLEADLSEAHEISRALADFEDELGDDDP